MATLPKDATWKNKSESASKVVKTKEKKTEYHNWKSEENTGEEQTYEGHQG